MVGWMDDGCVMKIKFLLSRLSVVLAVSTEFFC